MLAIKSAVYNVGHAFYPSLRIPCRLMNPVYISVPILNLFLLILATVSFLRFTTITSITRRTYSFCCCSRVYSFPSTRRLFLIGPTYLPTCISNMLYWSISSFSLSSGLLCAAKLYLCPRKSPLDKATPTIINRFTVTGFAKQLAWQRSIRKPTERGVSGINK